MRQILSTAALFLFVVVFVNVVPAQDTPRTINGGSLNGKAIKLPKPAYPNEARMGKFEGTVSIRVTVDEEGNVIDAEADAEKSVVVRVGADGSKETIKGELPDSSLVEAARAAALEAKFSPTRLSGQPVKVTGHVTYNFSFHSSDVKFISGGVLNGKAVSLPKPEYPAAALAVRASGTVNVQVLIDENGDVISATAASGHPLLRAAAVDAARLAKFTPTLLEGNAVKVSGVVTYNFALPDDGQN